MLQLPHSARRTTMLAVLALTTTIGGNAFAASATIDQVRNGVASAPTTPEPSWTTGNAGASNSHYLESHSIAYRATLDQLPTDGTVIELIVGYDVKRSGSYAIDYLTQYQRLLPHVLFGHRQPEVFDPLSGITGVASGVSTAPIPLPGNNLVVDPDGVDPDPALAQPLNSMAGLPDAERVMTLFGGNLLDVTYVSEADVALATKSSETRVRVRFTANGPKAVLAWGGHIACRWDWGFNADGTPRSAGGISGSSYHMRLVGWNLGSIGNQDRSMSTDAVYPVPKCGVSNLGPFCAGSANTHAAPAGMESYAWSLFGNTSGATIVGSDTSLTVRVQTSSAGSYGLMVTTGASGFTRQCQATVTVNAPVVADAGPDQMSCATAPQVQLAGNVGGGTAQWSGGAGTFSPGSADVHARYTPTAAELLAGGVTLTLTATPAGGPCPSVNDAVRITIQRAATTNAGVDATVCAASPQVQLVGSVGGSATTGTWSGGAGQFNPNASTLNAIYVPSAAEILAGGVTLTLTSNDPDGPCDAASDAIHIGIQPAATANAGPDLTVCASSPQAQLAGAVGGGAASGTWTGGAGGFSPGATSLTAIYTPTAAEVAAGGVTLTLTSNDPAGPCGTAADPIRITILPAATVNAGPDLSACSSSPQVQLAGAVGGGASGGTWSGGGGILAGGPTALTTLYIPSAAEIAAGGVTLTLTTNDPAGPCPSLSDAVHIALLPAATVNAGPDQSVCASSARADLQGAVSGGATSATWSGGAGSFSPRTTALNASYTPTAAEIAAGGVTLTLTTNDPTGPCPPVSDAVRITIDPVTVVNAGADQTVCSSSPRVDLLGSVSGTVSGGTWSGGAGAFSPNASALHASYVPSATEIAAGSVTLVLTSAASSGPCPPASDAMAITINRAVTVHAGPDQTVCAASPQVQLAGALGNGATSALWSGGLGTFSPNAAALNASYLPSPGEVAAGSVTLTLTTNDPVGPCPPVQDAVQLSFDAPTVSVASRTVCSGITPVTLCATPGRGVAPFTYRWSTGATGACITVSDTGSYTVTMTDARGCTATGSGAFRQRDCVGQLAHTTTTCGTFMAGTGDDFAEVHYVLHDGVITSISPGVFFYYTKVTAPRANFTIELVQTRDNPDFPFCGVQQDQVALYDADCNRLATGTETSPGQAAVQVQGATVGQVFIVSVKYSLKTLLGSPMDETTGVHYDFSTVIDGHIVDADPDGLLIGAASPGGAGGAGTGSQDPVAVRRPERGNALLEDPLGALPTYRPVPNPFRDGMRMTYAVESAGSQVDISIFDLAGRRVRTLESGFQSAGRHSVAWDGRDEHGERVRKGMYFVHARIGDQARQVRVTFLD